MAFDASKFIEGLGEAKARVEAAARRAVDRFGEHVIGDAQELTPVLTGALQASGTTEPAKLEGESIEKTVGFNTDYAAAVHEKLDAEHAVGEAKFLTNAMKNNASKMAPFIGEELKAALG